uniref:Uncharacterized protein n=1 Tax=Timema poppense TaxID=170557 RepID=A0A7R9H580_TIMPO|nr:unnamed protein product [Timema poppensis]
MVDGFTSLLATFLDDSPRLVGYKENNSPLGLNSDPSMKASLAMAGVALEVGALSVRYKPPPKECPTACSDLWEPVCAGEDLYTIRTFQNLCSVELHECNTKDKNHVKEMAIKLLEALNKRFKAIEENKVFAEATVLDPRFKRHGFSDSHNFERTYGFFTSENVEHLSYASRWLPSQLQLY